MRLLTRVQTTAGLPMEKVAGSKTSCFMGAFMRDYDGVLLAKDANKPGQYKATGNGNSLISNRIVSSYLHPSHGTHTHCLETSNPWHVSSTECLDRVGFTTFADRVLRSTLLVRAPSWHATSACRR